VEQGQEHRGARTRREVVMSLLTQFGHSGSGLTSQKLRDIDAAAPRARLPPRALPDSVRRQMRLPKREGAPAARRNWDAPPEITTKEALFGEGAREAQKLQRQAAPQAQNRRQSDNYGNKENLRKAGAVVEVHRVPKNQGRVRAGSYASPYDAELNVGRMERMPT